MKTTHLLLFLFVFTGQSFSQTADEHFKRGISKASLHDHRGAIVDYNRAIELQPEYADVYYNRGVSKIILNRIDSGCLDLSRAGELGNEEAYKVIRDSCN